MLAEVGQDEFIQNGVSIFISEYLLKITENYQGMQLRVNSYIKVPYMYRYRF